ncbi:MAG: hypothetical protein J6B10_04300 [Lachnospiraceae bacterium]|nr:hypothetical protein [Lachnospiraceae bacterium]
MNSYKLGEWLSGFERNEKVTMSIRMKIKNGGRLYCPKCGSDRIAGSGKEYCHCGQCGTALWVEEQAGKAESEETPYVEERLKKAASEETTLEEAQWEEEPVFEQMSLF